MKKIVTAIKKPYLIKEFIKTKLNLLPYKQKKSKARSPLIIYVVINSVCNLKCKMCDVGQQEKSSQFYKNLVGSGGDFPIDKYKKFIDDVKHFKPDIVLSSTEPLLYKNLIEAIKYTKSKGMRCRLTTNGYLLKKYAKDLVKVKTDEIVISVDGPSKTHNEIRGVRNTFENIIEGIKEVNKYKKLYKNKYPSIGINFTILEDNFDKINETIKLFDKLNIFQFAINHLNFTTNEMSKNHNQLFPNYPCTESCMSKTELNKIDTKVLYKELKKAEKTYPKDYLVFAPFLSKQDIEIYYKQPEKKLKNNYKCTVPWRTAQICSNGDVIVLTRCFNVVMGNIFKENFNSIWNNRKYREFRKGLIKHNSFPGCNRCCGVF